MKKTSYCHLLIFVLFQLIIVARPSYSVNAPDSFADLAEKLLPAVVNISARQNANEERGDQGNQRNYNTPENFRDFFREFFEQQKRWLPQRRTMSLGSGFIIDSSGYIVTNNHVIEDADEIQVILQDDTNLSAEVVGRDTKTDLALLKVKTSKKLSSLDWGNSEDVRVGDWVLAIGNPFGFGGTVTAGIVSARSRDLAAGPYDDFIQTDASINRGNSGGPMFDIEGNVIGVNTVIISPTGGSVGVGFAVPSSIAKNVIDQLRRYGRTRRGWLGVHIQMVDDELAESLNLEKPRGALVASVTPNGPAERAGVEPSDVILTFNGQDVPDMRQLPRMVADTKIGDTVPVLLWRKGREVSLRVKIGELEEAESKGLIKADNERSSSTKNTARTISEIGLKVASINDALKQRFNLDSKTRGVIVVDVKQGSQAAEEGIRPGTLIVEIDQETVNTPAEVIERIVNARSSDRKVVLLLIEQDNRPRFVALRINEG